MLQRTRRRLLLQHRLRPGPAVYSIRSAVEELQNLLHLQRHRGRLRTFLPLHVVAEPGRRNPQLRVGLLQREQPTFCLLCEAEEAANQQRRHRQRKLQLLLRLMKRL